LWRKLQYDTSSTSRFATPFAVRSPSCVFPAGPGSRSDRGCPISSGGFTLNRHFAAVDCKTMERETGTRTCEDARRQASVPYLRKPSLSSFPPAATDCPAPASTNSRVSPVPKTCRPELGPQASTILGAGGLDVAGLSVALEPLVTGLLSRRQGGGGSGGRLWVGWVVDARVRLSCPLRALHEKGIMHAAGSLHSFSSPLHANVTGGRSSKSQAGPEMCDRAEIVTSKNGLLFNHLNGSANGIRTRI
jgi:hypothetical protein